MSIIGDGIVLGAGGESASIFVTGLSETDSVSATKGGKTVVGKWTQIPNPASVVPDGYKQVYYIQNNGTADVSLINTGIYWGNISKIEYVINELTGSGGMVFAGGVASTPWLTTDGRSNGITGLSHSFVNDGDSFASFTDATNNPFCISGWTDTTWTGTYQYKTVRLYDKSNKLVYDGVPAQRISDNAVGLYDLISKTFKSSGFTAGPEIPQYIDGFLIDKINSYGTWTITATRGTNTKTKDVIVDSASVLNVKISFRLPNGYTELNNIISGEGAYLDTQIGLDNLTSMTLQALAPAISDRVIAGAWKSGAGFMFGVSSYPSGDITYRTTSGGNWTNSGIYPDGKYHLFEMNYSSGLYIDGKQVTGAVSRYAANVHLFGSNGYGAGYADVSIKYCQMFNGETKLRDFVPAIRDSDGIVGMYDLVSNSFFTSATSVLFIAGEEVQ